MKITAIVPDELVRQAELLAGAETTTEALITALREWVAWKEIAAVTKSVKAKPLRFRSPKIAESVRTLNRRRS